MLLRVCLFVAAALALVLGAAASDDFLTVRMHVFSGTPDPEVRVAFCPHLFERLEKHVALAENRLAYPMVMGFRGFTVNGDMRVYDDASLETDLLRIVMEHADLPSTVEVHARERIFEMARPTSALRSKAKAAALLSALRAPSMPRPVAASLAPNRNCSVPVVGSDNVTVYDVEGKTDDCGLFQVDCGENNCYAYGTDIVTNTFPQPGRGSGREWTENTCENMRAASERDGLTWVGTELPTSGNVGSGHYLALLIWPGTNFHWVRMDDRLPHESVNYFSHKPGGTPVRNVDDNGKRITDPSQSDFAPWTQFCGYMHVVPSAVTIA